MATPRSAGRVLIKPMGDYNPATTYEMLDAVEYDGSTYLCKQTSTGNLPTNKTYWQKMVSVGADDFMAIDGSNADNVIFNGANESFAYIGRFDISKDAGENEPVTLVTTANHEGKTNVILEGILNNHIGGEGSFTYMSQGRRFVLDAVSVTAGTTSDTITLTAHLKVDRTDAMSASQQYVYLDSFASDNWNFIHGTGNNADGFGNTVIGRNLSADGENNFLVGSSSYVEGQNIVALGGQNYGTTGTFLFGQGLIAETTRQVVLGRNNNNKSTNAVEIGFGYANARKNVLEIKDDGSFSNNDGVDFYKFAKLNGKDGFYDTAGNFHYIVPNYLEQQVTLSTSADTTVTFTNAQITADSMIDVYTDAFGVNPSAMTATTGSATLTFPKVDTAQTITVRLVLM